MLIARNGAEFLIEPVMFVSGFAALVAAGGLAGVVGREARRALQRHSLPCSPHCASPSCCSWAKCSPFLFLAHTGLRATQSFSSWPFVATGWGIRVLRRRSTRRLD